MKALSLLIKPVSAACNMACRYCFYAESGGRRQAENHGSMSVETLEAIAKKALDTAEELLFLGFQGGEPTLAGLDFYRRLMELEKKHNSKNIEIRHTLQTNGLVIDDEWATFLAGNNFLTGLSIDAGKQLHDAMRPDASGKDTHNRCIEATRSLQKHNAHFSVMSVVTKAMASHPDKTYRYYKERNFRHLQFIPCQDTIQDGHDSSPNSLSAAVYGKFLCRMFDLWFADFTSGNYYSIRSFDNYVHMLGGHAPESCAMAGVCQNQLVVEADGSVYPCDFYADGEHCLGNILTDSIEELQGGEKAMNFINVSRQPNSECMACQYYGICRSGCRRDREPCAIGLPGKNVYCEAYKTFFAYALPRMRGLAERLFAGQQ